MMFSSNNDKNAPPKKRSTLGFLFNPDISGSIRPVGEVIGMFVRLIAMIFAMNGLFPRQHPALQNTKIKLTMGEVIATAYNGLSFTREGLPKVLLFVGVVGCLAFSALLVLTFLGSLLVGQAHAAGGMFDTPNESKDAAYGWLCYLFLADGSSSTACPDSVINGSYGVTVGGREYTYPLGSTYNLQKALHVALRFYSNGVLVFAGIILIYHLLSMVVETAHHGVAMGKRASQIWAPIRLVVAMGLLVPVGESGLNSGQYIVIQMARWGSGLASNVWNGVLAEMITQLSAGAPMKAPPVPLANELATHLATMKACQLAMNAMTQTLYAGDADLQKTYAVKLFPEDLSMGCGPKDCKFSFGTDRHQKLCGYIDIPDAPTAANAGSLGAGNNDLAGQLRDAQIRTIRTTLTAINSSPLTDVAKSVLYYLDKSYLGTTSCRNYPSSVDCQDKNALGAKPFGDLVTYYQNLLNANYYALTGGAAFKADQALKNVQSMYGPQGWVMAGASYMQLVRAQGAVIEAAQIMPIGHPPMKKDIGYKTVDIITSLGGVLRDVGGLQSPFALTIGALANFAAKDILPATINAPQLANSPATGAPGTPLAAAPTTNATKAGATANAILTAIDYIASTFGVWPEGNGLMFKFGQNASPLLELSYMGYQNVSVGLALITGGGIASILGGAVSSIVYGVAGLFTGGPVAAGAGALAGGIVAEGGGLVMTIGLIFLTSGFALAFILPMIPFIKFFFNVLTWILSVFEAVVAAPIFALAHVSPHGEGMPGDMARTGYFFILSITLRPVLMIFGLLAGLLLFNVAINFLNLTYSIAVQGSGAWGGSLAVLSKLVFSVMYVVLAYICANKCFQSISFFPDHALSWMSARGPESKSMGDAQLLNSTTAAVGGMMAERVIGGGMRGIGNLASKPGSAYNTEKSSIAARDRHDKLIRTLGGANSTLNPALTQFNNPGSTTPPVPPTSVPSANNPPTAPATTPPLTPPSTQAGPGTPSTTPGNLAGSSSTTNPPNP